MMNEEDANEHGEGLDLQGAVAQDVLPVITAAEEGDAAEPFYRAASIAKVKVVIEPHRLSLHCESPHCTSVRPCLLCTGYRDIVSMRQVRSANDQEQLKLVLDSIDNEGGTSLHHAARGNRADVLQLLLLSGANPKDSKCCWTDLADPDSPQPSSGEILLSRSRVLNYASQHLHATASSLNRNQSWKKSWYFLPAM